MTRNRLIAPTLTALVLVALLAAATVPATAGHESDESLNGLLETSDNDNVIDTIRAAVSGVTERFRSDAEADASTDAEAAIQAFNEKSGDYVAYANGRNIAEGTDTETIAVRFDDGDTTETIIIEAQQSNGEYTSAEAVWEANSSADFDSADEWVVLREDASANAADELRDFHEQFVVDDENVTESYKKQKATRYGGADQGVAAFIAGESMVESSLLGDEKPN